MKNEIAARVAMVRTWMNAAGQGFSAVIVPTMDPHDSEYVAGYWQLRQWVSGFTGSAGLVLIMPDEALLWTDSRYWLQAEEQLCDTPFRLMREGVDVSVADYIKVHVQGTIGFPSDMMSPSLYASLFSGRELRERAVPFNSGQWNEMWLNRPSMPSSPVEYVADELSGESSMSRISRVLEWMRKRHRSELLIADLSEVCWLLNLRASDIPYNSFLLAFLLLRTNGEHILFLDMNRVDARLKAYLGGLGITPAPYAEGLKRRIKNLDSTEDESPVSDMKAIKNAVESEGFRTAHLRDGVAMVRFLRLMDECQGKGYTELSAARLLHDLRAEQPGFCGLSFETISAYGAHGAIVHYEPTEKTDIPLSAPEGHGGGLFLLDSGAHYDCGTTDITRTIGFGSLTDEERLVYTLVLKGHLQLMYMMFPQGTTGLQLDTAARASMWRRGYDFGHGTGHGVGYRLGVHEGPSQIRKDVRACTLLPFRPGQVITDEPGIYVPGRFGVRIENMLLCREAVENEFGRFLCFEPLTMCPYDLRPVKPELLMEEERNWLNVYHQKVRQRLAPLLPDAKDRDWLITATERI